MTKPLLATASLIVIFGGMMMAHQIVAPFLLSVFFAMILVPPLRWLQRKGLSETVAILLLSAFIILIGLVTAGVVGSSLSRFRERLPVYQEKLTANISSIETMIQSHIDQFEQTAKNTIEQITVPSESSGSDVGEIDTANETTLVAPIVDADNVIGNDTAEQKVSELFSLRKLIDFQVLSNYAMKFTQDIISLLSYMFMVIITVIFMLLEASRFSEKSAAAFGGNGQTGEHIKQIAANVWKYTVIKGLISMAVGGATWIFLLIVGVEYALLWGILAFFLNFIPNIGSIIASVPPILLAWIDLGLGTAVLVTGGLVAINFAIGYGVEPKFLGDGLGLSALIVLLSLIFWGWLLGPVGMFLSAPLTMIVKIVLQAYERTKWVAVLLGTK
ncbi:MAG: AI-2E family transporter [Planctomycetaceae bacterium]|jgi:predicted PurR-regulated permease PerM|nr:AI-2E family transporter [Planctomycetaceae bacterium]